MTTLTPDQPPNPEPNPAPGPTPIAERVSANRWRNSPRIRERLVKVAGLRQRGLGQAAIANRLGVSEATISRDLRRLPLLWRQEHAHFVNSERLRNFAALREAERFCWRQIDSYQADADRVSELSGVISNLTGVAREIRMLLKHARPPQPHDYWGYEDPMTPLRMREALEERYQPPDKVVLGLLPYEDDPPDDDPELAGDPELAVYRKINNGLADLELAVDAGVAPEALERRLKEMSSHAALLRQLQGRGDGGGASRNGVSVDFEDDE